MNINLNQIATHFLPLTSLGTTQIFTCRIKRGNPYHFISNPLPLRNKRSLKSYPTHPLICMHDSWFTFIMFNFKYYFKKLWNGLLIPSFQPISIVMEWALDPLLSTNFHLYLMCNFLDGPLTNLPPTSV